MKRFDRLDWLAIAGFAVALLSALALIEDVFTREARHAMDLKRLEL